MKKAIIAVPYLSGKGGTETVVKNFYDAVVASSNTVEWKLISFGGSKYSTWLENWNKKVYHFTNKRIIQLGAYATLMPILLRNLIKKEQPDYFITTNPIMWHIASKLRDKYSPSTKVIAWYHYSYKMKKVKPKYLNKVDKFWAISTGIRDELVNLGVSTDKIDVVFNPIKYNSSPLIKRSKNHNSFIYIGRIDYDGQKNVAELMKALNLVKENYKLNLYGAIDSNLKNKLLNLINDPTQRNNIIFHGFKKNVWNEIKEADTLILTSKYEGFPMVVCEAASRGISLVAADCPTGLKDIVTTHNGFLYPMGDIKTLTNILNGIINSNQLPQPEKVAKSVSKFDYQHYARRIMQALD